MNFDINTLAFVFSLLGFIQVSALFVQYRLDRTHPGLEWWALGNASWALGTIFNYLRYIPSFITIAVIANNIFFITGLALIYTGVVQFLGRRQSQGWMAAFCTVMILISVYFTLVIDNLAFRRLVFSFALAVISFQTAWNFFKHKTPSIATLANFLAGVFLANALFFSLRALTFFYNAPSGSILTDALIQIITYLAVIIFSTLWTFGLIILVNQRLNAENFEIQKNQDLIFNTSPDAVLITRLSDGAFYKVNNGFTTLTGFTQADISGKSTLEINLWKNLEDRKKLIEILTEKEFCENLEVVMQRKDGSLFDGLISARVISLEGVPYMISVTHDIGKLRETENKFRLLFKLSPVGMAMIDNKSGKFLEVNDAVLRSTGYSKEEFLNLSIPEITPPEYEEQELNKAREISETGHFGPYEKEFFRKDGSRYPVSISGALFTNEKGKQMIWGIIEDISSRKQAEEEKRKIDTWLRTLSIAIEQTPVTTVITDLNGDIVFANPKFEETTGYKVEEAIGQNPRILKTGDMSASVYKELWDTILSGQSWHGTFHNKKKNGELYWESAIISPVKDEEGKITHFLAVKEDITERKHLQEELEKQATTDALTGVTNRRRFLELAQTELKRTIRHNRPLSMALIDLDHFKTINDTYGHAGGDLVLVSFANTCLKNIREIDIFARFGGDEFILLFPETNGEQAYAVLERVYQALTNQPVLFNDKPLILTLSSGISSIKRKDDTLDILIGRADEALYQAKETGRNRIVLDQK
jgi:diguanylate cyclase (GGDEF)-like protein/PAS domain S-box-containing protein